MRSADPVPPTSYLGPLLTHRLDLTGLPPFAVWAADAIPADAILDRRGDAILGGDAILDRQAARWRWIDENPARHVRNPRPQAPEIQPFESWQEIEAIAAELEP